MKVLVMVSCVPLQCCIAGGVLWSDTVYAARFKNTHRFASAGFPNFTNGTLNRSNTIL